MFSVKPAMAQNTSNGNKPPTSLKDKIMIQVHGEEIKSSSKITIVGTGQVGMAAAYSLMIQVK